MSEETNGKGGRINRKEANFTMYATFMSIVTAVVGSLSFFGSVVMDVAFDTGVLGTALIYVIPVVMTIYSISVMIGAHLYHNRSMLPFYLIATIWLGCFTYIFVFSGLVLLPLVLFRTGLIPHEDLILTSLQLILILGPILAVSAGVVNARYLRLREVKLPMNGLKRNVRVGFFSDLHLGLLIGERRLERIIDIMRDRKPDLIIIGGDLFDTEPGNIAHMLPLLHEFSRIAPTYAVNGNHRYFNDLEACDRSMRDAGMELLINGRKMDRGSGITIYGVTDPAGHQQYAEERVDLDQTLGENVRIPAILVSHQPLEFSKASEKGIGLMLSGHTHGGQIAPFGLITRLIFREGDRGLKRKGDSSLFVSTGAGTWGPPMRLGTSPEVVILDLVPK